MNLSLINKPPASSKNLSPLRTAPLVEGSLPIKSGQQSAIESAAIESIVATRNPHAWVRSDAIKKIALLVPQDHEGHIISFLISIIRDTPFPDTRAEALLTFGQLLSVMELADLLPFIRRNVDMLRGQWVESLIDFPDLLAVVVRDPSFLDADRFEARTYLTILATFSPK